MLEVICDKHMIKSPAYPKEVGTSAEIFHGLTITKISEERANGFIRLCGLGADNNAFECDWCRRTTEKFGGVR